MDPRLRGGDNEHANKKGRGNPDLRKLYLVSADSRGHKP